MELQKPISQQVTNMENMAPHPSQDHTQQNLVQPPVDSQPQQPPQSNQEPQPNGDVLAYHGNEMGSTLSNHYSFLEESDNSSLNHNFTFVGDTNIQPNTQKVVIINNQTNLN